MSTLGMFGESLPKALVRHLDMLLPYLKADNQLSTEDEAKILLILCQLLTSLVHSQTLPASTIQDMLSDNSSVPVDLERITYKFGSAASSAAIETLSALSHASSHDRTTNRAQEQLLKLSKTFYSYLFKIKDSFNDYSSAPAGVNNNLQRALSVLGATCQYHDNRFEGQDSQRHLDDANWALITPPNDLTWDNVSDCCFRLFYFYLTTKTNDASTQCAALRALTGVFMARPRMMLAVERSGLLHKIMSDNPLKDQTDQHRALLQLEALKCWRDILLAEEWRVESGTAKQQLDHKAGINVSKRISGDQDGDASLVGSVLSQHSSRLYELATISPHAALRLAAVELIGHLLRQGLINPMETVPHLFALQGDVSNPSIRLLALQILIREGEKRPDMLRQRVCAGIHQAYLFQRRHNAATEDIVAVIWEKDHGQKKPECVFARIYNDSLSASRVQKHAMYKSLLGLFTTIKGSGYLLDESDESFLEDDSQIPKSEDKTTPTGIALRSRNKIRKSNCKTPEDRTKDLVEGIPLLCYASQLLAHLPYAASVDVLYVIHQITKILALEGGQLLDRFAILLGPYIPDLNGDEKEIESYSKETNPDGEQYDDINVRENSLEKAGNKIKFPSRSKVAKFICEENCFSVPAFAALCAEASGLILLMRLRLFLKKTYSLNETRCLEFNPNDTKIKVQDRGIATPEIMELFHNRIPSFFVSGSNDWNKDSLIIVYSEFRRSLRTNCEWTTSTGPTKSSEYMPSGDVNTDGKEHDISTPVSKTGNTSATKKRRRSGGDSSKISSRKSKLPKIKPSSISF